MEPVASFRPMDDLTCPSKPSRATARCRQKSDWIVPIRPQSSVAVDADHPPQPLPIGCGVEKNTSDCLEDLTGAEARLEE